VRHEAANSQAGENNMALSETIVISGIFAWIWDKYGKDIADKSGRKLWDRVGWSEAERRYLENVVKDYGTTRFLGKPEPVKLTDIFTHVKILDKPRAMRFYSKEQLLKQFAERRFTGFGDDDERLSGFEALTKHDRLFILGKPGAGKTTFLKYVAIESAQGRGVGKVPIFVGLKQLADSGAELLDFVADEFLDCGFPDASTFVEKLLESGKAIILFDGLDEVNLEGRQRYIITRMLNRFARRYDTCQFVITCRIAATDYTFPQFTYTEMADFDREQQREFIGNWFLDDGLKREMCWLELDHADNKDLREMAQVPLLLGLLCLGFEETGMFPYRRVEIYEEALDALLKKWDSSRNIQRDQVYKHLSLGRKRQLLARIAAEAFQNSEYFIAQRRLEEQIAAYLSRIPGMGEAVDIDSEAILKAIEAQHGILVERANRIHSFSHLTFQEYYTARYIVDNATLDTIDRMMKHFSDRRWREVFLLVASMLDDANRFFHLFSERISVLLDQSVDISELLNWVEQERIREIRLKDHKPRLVRLWFLNILSDLPLARFRLAALLGEMTRAHYLGVSLNYLSIGDTDIDIDPNNELSLDSELVSDFIREQGESRDLSKSLARLRLLASTLSQEGLVDEVGVLSLPDYTSTDAEWKNFSRTLKLIISRYRPIALILLELVDGYLEYSDIPQVKSRSEFETFMYASNLVQDCLKLAVVDDRSSIEDRLLLPLS
jgi:energy-coupling factor transporter ATP-binding protein EcfA2